MSQPGRGPVREEGRKRGRQRKRYTYILIGETEIGSYFHSTFHTNQCSSVCPEESVEVFGGPFVQTRDQLLFSLLLTPHLPRLRGRKSQRERNIDGKTHLQEESKKTDGKPERRPD